MMECPREQEVIQAIVAGSVEDEAVRAHLAACETCAEAALLAAALRDDQPVACGEASLPAAGTVWWRATIRARADAARLAARPITAWQGVAVAVAIGLVAGVGGMVWRLVTSIARFGGLIDILQARRSDIAAASALIAQHGIPVVLAIAACAIIAPLAIYFATAGE